MALTHVLCVTRDKYDPLTRILTEGSIEETFMEELQNISLIRNMAAGKRRRITFLIFT